MALTIGFPHSGSSLIGCLMTAHPNIIFGHEPIIKRNDGDFYKYPLYRLFYTIIYFDIRRLRIKQKVVNMHIFGDSYFTIGRGRRYTLIPNQYQGQVKLLKVIGIKHSEMNIKSSRILEMFKRKLEMKKIVGKYIFTVRNPYDMIVTRCRDCDIGIQDSIDVYINFCNKNQEIIEQHKSQDILFCKHEDMIENPKQQIARLCDFLAVPAADDYLNDCASQVAQKSHKSRFERNWTQAQKKQVMQLIEKYDFLSGYSWES